MERKIVELIRQRGGNIAGEKIFVDESDIPSLVAGGYVADSQSQPEALGEEASSSGSAKPAAAAKKKPAAKNSPNPFAIDGLDDATIDALSAAGINSPEDVQAWIDSGKTVESIGGLTAAAIVAVKENYLS